MTDKELPDGCKAMLDALDQFENEITLYDPDRRYSIVSTETRTLLEHAHRTFKARCIANTRAPSAITKAEAVDMLNGLKHPQIELCRGIFSNEVPAETVQKKKLNTAIEEVICLLEAAAQQGE